MFSQLLLSALRASLTVVKVKCPIIFQRYQPARDVARCCRGSSMPQSCEAFTACLLGVRYSANVSLECKADIWSMEDQGSDFVAS